MKETRLIKIHIILLILSLCFLFSVPLIMEVFAKPEKQASAEEPGIPLETYLNGNFKNMPFTMKNSKRITLKPSKHLKSTKTITDEINLYFKETQSVQKNTLKIMKYKSNNFEDNTIYGGKILVSFTSAIGFWNGVEASYSISYYRGGKNIYTKNYQEKMPESNNYRDFFIEKFQDTKAPGLYIFHMHHIIHTIGYWDAKERISYLKNHVFAFQIGDGDDIKTTVTGSNINGETKDLTNSMYSSKEEAEKHPIYTRTVPTITAETTYNQMSMICGYLYDPAIKKYRDRMVGHSYTFDEDHDDRQITMKIVTLKGLDKRYISIFYDKYKPMISFKLEKPTHKYDERRFGRSISELYIRDDGVGNSGLEYTSLQKWIRGVGYQEHGDINAAINDKLTEEGEWKIIARDKAGNENVKYFTISNQFRMEMDKDVQPDNQVLYTNKDVKLTFSVTPSTNQQQVKIETYDSHGNLINEIWRDIQSGSKSIYLSDLHYPEATDNFKDGDYYFCAWDWTGTMIKQKFRIDHGKPTLTVNGKTHINGDIVYTNSKDTLDIKANDNVRLHRIDLIKTTSSGTEVIEQMVENASSIKFNKEEVKYDPNVKYEIDIVDKAGNHEKYEIIFDFEAPNIQLEGYTTKGTSSTSNTEVYFANQNLSMNFSDSHALDKVTVQFRDEKTNNVTELAVQNNQLIVNQQNGEYRISMTDKAGNKKTVFILSYKNEIEDETVKLSNDFSVPYYWQVEFRSEYKHYPGSYIFKTREDAVQFAYNAEFRTKVKSLGNNGWQYYAANSHQLVTYKKDERDKLVSRIHKEIVKFISERKIDDSLHIPGNTHFMKDFQTEDRAAFNEMTVERPPFIQEKYSDLALYQLKHNHRYTFSYIYKSRKQVSFQFLGNASEVSSSAVNINEKSIGSQLTNEGFYLVTEYDLFGNYKKYLVYFDKTAPSLKAIVTKGNGEQVPVKEEIVFDEEYISTHGSLFRFLSFSPTALADWADKNHCTIDIRSKSVKDRYLSGDSMRTMSYENAGEKYEITLTDRSGNQLKFTVVIPSGIPTWNFDQTSNDDELNVTFYPGKENDFESIEIYKYDSDNECTKLERDDDGQLITNTRLEYKFVNGGKYQAVMKDIFNRTVRTRSRFFYKDLPTGRLSIENGGITNRSVFFYYDNTLYTAKMFRTTKTDTKADRIELTPSVDYRDQKLTAGKQEMGIVSPDCDLTYYVIQLVDKKNKNQFAEWTFRIDTVLSPTTITDENGTEMSKNEVTNKNFRFHFDDSELKIKITHNGSLININRAKEMLFEKEGTYRFEISDQAGNHVEYTMEIDKTVKFRVAGAKKIDDTHYISNKTISIVDDEKYSLAHYSVEGHDNMNIKDKFENDGVYKITLRDVVGNEKIIFVRVDKTPPTITVSSKLTKDSVTVTYSDGERVELYKDGTLSVNTLSSGTVIDSAGKYKVVVYDSAGNVATEHFEIKRHILATFSVPCGAVTTEQVSFSQGEKLTVKAFNGTDAIETEKTYTKPGKYTIKMTDSLGNENEFYFEIIKSKMQTFNLKLADGHKVLSVMKNEEFVPISTEFKTAGKYEVICASAEGKKYLMRFELNNEKPKVVFKKHNEFLKILRGDKKKIKAKLYRNGTLVSQNYKLQPIKESGKYTLEVEDEFGNKTVIHSKFRKPLNANGIGAIVGSVLVVGIVVGLIIYFAVRKKKIA